MEKRNLYFLRKILGLTLVFGSFAFFTTSCYYDNEEDLYPIVTQPLCDTISVSYSETILPIMESECYSCHDQGSRFGNVDIEGYDNLKSFVDNGLLWGSIAHLDGFSAMPKGGSQLPDCDLNKVQAWINDGAPNN